MSVMEGVSSTERVGPFDDATVGTEMVGIAKIGPSVSTRHRPRENPALPHRHLMRLSNEILSRIPIPSRNTLHPFF